MARTLLFSLVTLALVVLSSRLRGGEDEAHVQFTRAGALTGDEPVVEVYEVLPPMKRLRIRLALRLDEGGAEWQLVDPAGEVRWRGTAKAGAGGPTEEQELEAAAGRWALTITPRDAEGGYTLRWRGDS